MEATDTAAQTTALLKTLQIDKHKLDVQDQLQRVFNFMGHGAVVKSEKPVRIGILGASQV